jgi:hypothetical protein
MPSWLKIVLAILAVLFALFLVVGFIGFRYLQAHKDEWVAQGKKAQQEGEAFAAGKEATQCVDEAVRQIAGCNGLPCEIRVRLFLGGCLGKATPSAQLCANVPHRSEVIRSAKWSLDECAQRGLPNNPPCTRLMQEVQRYCVEPAQTK